MMEEERVMQGVSKEDFLQDVRNALGKKEPTRRAPEHVFLKASIRQQAQKADAILKRIETKRPQLLERFEEMAHKGGWKVSRVESPRELGRRVAKIARSVGATDVVRTDEELFERFAVDDPLRWVGVAVTPLPWKDESSETTMRRLIESAHIGITGVKYAIAETGTCVLVAGKNTTRIISLLPPVHIAIVESTNVVETLDDVMSLERMEYRRIGGRRSRYMNFITGPSRSADIEQTIAVGVHGPREVFCVLIG
jgi:L-lactate dehydrogenase complex protein LldG